MQFHRVLEVALDDELELSDYLVNFRRMFGEQTVQTVHAVRTARNRTQIESFQRHDWVLRQKN
ncbi:MAG: hypothetical protein KBT82_06430 [Marinobacter sp.]|uniref:hypothetical protein n=1 Tax=Marinobacter sp. TaxID=50741 RepID=UPI001B66F4CB|nr:hypothetical protein [Marinobacter sp.]